MIFNFCVVIGYFILLYILCYFANRNHKGEGYILGVEKLQWRALFVMWLPSLFVFL